MERKTSFELGCGCEFFLVVVSKTASCLFLNRFELSAPALALLELVFETTSTDAMLLVSA